MGNAIEKATNAIVRLDAIVPAKTKATTPPEIINHWKFGTMRTLRF